MNSADVKQGDIFVINAVPYETTVGDYTFDEVCAEFVSKIGIATRDSPSDDIVNLLVIGDAREHRLRLWPHWVTRINRLCLNPSKVMLLDAALKKYLTVQESKKIVIPPAADDDDAETLEIESTTRSLLLTAHYDS